MNLENWTAPQWMVEAPKVEQHCGDCGSQMQKNEDRAFCLLCWTFRTYAFLESAQTIQMRVKLAAANFYVNVFWLHCGAAVRNIPMFHRVLNKAFGFWRIHTMKMLFIEQGA